LSVDSITYSIVLTYQILTQYARESTVPGTVSEGILQYVLTTAPSVV